MNNKIIFSILAVVVGVSAFTVIKYKKKRITANQAFLIESPVKKDLIQYVSSTGNLRAKDFLSIGALESGKVIEILADDNDVVKKNQVLVILDNGVGDAAVKQQQATLVEVEAIFAFQTKFFARQKALFESGQLSGNLFDSYKKDFEVAKAKVDQTKAALRQEQQRYDNLFIKSPEDGMVIAKNVDLGQMVTSQLQATVLFEVAKDLRKMEARIDVDESDIGMIKEGQNATFVVDAFPKERFTAKVKQVEYQAKNIDNVVTYATILEVENLDLKLRPGMTTNVDIKVAEVDNALCIQNKALRINKLTLEQAALKADYTVQEAASLDSEKPIGKKIKLDQESIWIVVNNTLKQVPVELGSTDGKFTQITKGLTKNDKVITEVLDVTRENLLLKGMFGKPGGIGSK